MENSHRFFENRACKYFPCHNMSEGSGAEGFPGSRRSPIQEEAGEFNCLFCYCPLYHLGDQCGGIFEYYKGTKSCISCHLPHLPEYYDTVTTKLKNAPKHTPAKEASND